MKKGLFFSIIFICIFLNNCKKAPVYPDTPEIEFHSIDKYPAGDSIVITINFKDGDGDLGLEDANLTYPYNEFDYKRDGFGNFIKYTGDPQNFACKEHSIGYFFDPTDLDTVLINYNPYYDNFIIDILIKQPDGSYVTYDNRNDCPDDYSRFPPLSPENDKGPIKGSLTHVIKTDLFLRFPGDTLKFQIYIIDRALNKSNVIETPDIVMN